MHKEKLSLQSARQLAVHSQLLGGADDLIRGKEGVAQVIEKLGYVQIDTINVIKRAHHHTLWTRCPDYDAEMLHELQAKDRRIFEYWGHAMSYLPMCDYRYYLPRMQSFYDPYHKWEKRRLEKFGYLMEPVLKRIRQEGAMSTKDFVTEEERKGGTWWDWRPVKVALELLFWRGDLMITERRKFQKVYDLTERVLPEGVDTRMPDEDELGQFLVRRALSSYGIAKEKEIREHIRAANREVVARSLQDLEDEGEVMRVEIDKKPDGEYFALTKKLADAGNLKENMQVHLLSPFDNFTIQRGRLKDLFGFDYALECYLKPEKRKYGYFILPILWGERFVGRLDPKADRKEKKFIIRKLMFEEKFTPDGNFLGTLAERIMAFACFNGCEQVQVEQVYPKRLKSVFVKSMNIIN